MSTSPSEAPSQSTGKSWPSVIQAVQSPLGMLALLALIASGVLTFLATQVRGRDLSTLLVATLALLFFLAIAATRLALRERSVAMPVATSGLKPRSDAPPLERAAREASDLYFLGVSLYSFVPAYTHFFESKLRKGCNLHFILLSPDSPALETWEMISRFPSAKNDILRTLDNLESVVSQAEKFGVTRDRCKIRLSKVFLPYSLIMVDPAKHDGWMVVEYYTYKTTVSERPHLELVPHLDGKWFELYRSQFQDLWNDSEPWAGQSSGARVE